MKTTIQENLRRLKAELSKEGFHILGVFGSYARNEETEKSDIDILYRLEAPKFLSLYPGFRAFGRLTDIKQLLEKSLQKDVDIADIEALHEIGKKYILKDFVYV